MKIADLKTAGHWPTLLTAFLYFDFSFMAWTLLGPLGAQIGEALNLSAQQKGMMVAVPILSGAVLRIVLGLAVDQYGAKRTGICAQLIVILGLLCAWLVGLKDYQATLLLGTVLGFAGMEECKPCYWMNSAIGPGAEDWLQGRGGLRARILTNGILQRTV